MKNKIIVAVALVVVAAGAYYAKGSTNVIQYQKSVETVEVEVDALQKRLDDALTASSTEIEARANAAYNNAKNKAELETKLQATSAYRAEVEAQEKTLMKQVSL